jgi:hypothetical protein
LVFNAVSRALSEHDRWVPLSARMAITEDALASLAGAGMVVVSAEDLRVMFGHWRRSVTNVLGAQDAYDRLRAALPERTTADE